jgi:prophage regulatory protein
MVEIVDEILREPEVKTLTKLSRTTRYYMEKRGEFPKGLELTGRARGHLRSEVLAWLSSRTRRGSNGAAA